MSYNTDLAQILIAHPIRDYDPERVPLYCVPDVCISYQRCETDWVVVSRGDFGTFLVNIDRCG